MRGLPKSPPRELPDGWVYGGIELVTGQAVAGTASAYSVAKVRNGDLMFCFGAIRNGTITGPSSSGWTTDYAVDESSNEWNKVFSKVANAEADFTFGSSSSCASGFAVFRKPRVPLAITAQAHQGHSTNRPNGASVAVTAGGAYVGMYISAAFDDREGTEFSGMLEEACYLYGGGDELVECAWEHTLQAGTYGSPYFPRNSSSIGTYGSWHSYAING